MNLFGLVVIGFVLFITTAIIGSRIYYISKGKRALSKDALKVGGIYALSALLTLIGIVGMLTKSVKGEFKGYAVITLLAGLYLLIRIPWIAIYAISLKKKSKERS